MWNHFLKTSHPTLESTHFTMQSALVGCSLGESFDNYSFGIFFVNRFLFVNSGGSKHDEEFASIAPFNILYSCNHYYSYLPYFDLFTSPTMVHADHLRNWRFTSRKYVLDTLSSWSLGCIFSWGLSNSSFLLGIMIVLKFFQIRSVVDREEQMLQRILKQWRKYNNFAVYNFWFWYSYPFCRFFLDFLVAYAWIRWLHSNQRMFPLFITQQQQLSLFVYILPFLLPSHIC